MQDEQPKGVAPPSAGSAEFPLDGLLRHADGLLRCSWCGHDADYVAYHDHEWGRPQRCGRALFEKLSLEGFQAGLSWLTVLRRREAFRAAFCNFDPTVVARMDDGDVERLLRDTALIRHRGKIEAVVANARIVVGLGGTAPLARMLWEHARPLTGRPRHPSQVPVKTAASAQLSTTLRHLGWRFIGPTSAYAFMQSVGMVDDHVQGCHT